MIVFAIALRPADPYGGIGAGWTLETLRSLGNPNYPAILWRTLWLVGAHHRALPAAGHAGRLLHGPRRRRAGGTLLLLAVIVPFWTSFLVRIFAWKVLLHPEGALKHLLVALRLVPPGRLAALQRRRRAAGDGLHRPAVRHPADLRRGREVRLPPARGGARPRGERRCARSASVFLPGIRRGLLTAILVVFIPALGSYVMPDLVGGPTSEMIGNKIAQRTFVDRNLPHASALSALLTLAVLVPLDRAAIALERGRRVPRQGGPGVKRSRSPVVDHRRRAGLLLPADRSCWCSTRSTPRASAATWSGFTLRLVPAAVARARDLAGAAATR